MKNLWRFLRSPSGTVSVLTLLACGLIAGLVLVFATHKTFQVTSTEAFCTSCHTMEQPLLELKQSVHYNNASGVRATCNDCHMPTEVSGQIFRKMEAAKDVYHQFFTKKIDTPEQYEEHRLEMAQSVWDRMEANDSSSCRGCHSYEAMDHSKQSANAAKQMLESAKTNQTCISCHKGIAHELPDMSGGYRKSFITLEKEAAKPPKADTLVTLTEVEMFKTRDAKENVGKLLPATEITVLSRKGDMLMIEVQGWKDASKKRGRVLTQEPGKRIFSATLKSAHAKTVEVIDTRKVGDEQKEWLKVSTKAWIKNEHLLADIKPIWDYTDELYQATCTQCHGAPDINHFSSTEWIAQLKGMMDFVDINKREERTLLKYLQTFGADSEAGAKAH